MIGSCAEEHFEASRKDLDDSKRPFESEHLVWRRNALPSQQSASTSEYAVSSDAAWSSRVYMAACCCSNHRLLASSFLGFPYRILNRNHKKELLRSLWVSLALCAIALRLGQRRTRNPVLVGIVRGSGSTASS